ncbi:hypothetical protein MWU65_13210 [Cellulophaga sp. F20128]|uniref:hypothetical protein n=1 Tax=Cellulophaga sp. F20128 TaxID=2926413 RepID=UPI001FF2E028|nr:hypothetical protein [Cellulophaga sp. F20128]MCK0158146.1 hypothetical protein [Cellulophaga sp. F20128]
MKKILNIIIILAVLLIWNPVQSQRWGNNKKKTETVKPEGKIWEQTEKYVSVVYQEGKYKANFTYTRLKNLPKDFIAEVNNRTYLSSLDDLYITYRGACAKEIILRPAFVHGGDKSTLLNAYKASGNSSDLPIHEMLKPLLKGFLAQCDELESIRIEMGTYQGNIYRGTMKKSNNWKLEDGFQETSDDYAFKLNTGKDIFTALGIYYEGKCQKTATMNIAPMFSNDTEKTFYKKKASFIDFSRIAKIAIDKYSAECINAETLNFTLDFVPTGYRCKEGTNCTLTASKLDNWEIDKSNFELIPYVAPLMTTYKDVIELLDKGDFESFTDDYTPFFQLFYEEYSNLYGSFCNNNLVNPAKVVTRTFEVKTFADGSKTESELYPPSESFIETEYLPIYKAFKSRNNLTTVTDAFKLVMRVYERKNLNLMQNELSYRIGNSNTIVKHLKGKCNSPKVKNVYTKMQELAAKLN